MPSNNSEQLIDMVKRHYKKTSNEKRGKREIREIHQIFKDTLKEFPEYVARKQRNKMKESHSKMASTIS